MITDDTVGLRSSQFSAIWGTVLPVSVVVERVHDRVQLLVVHRRSRGRGDVQPAAFGQRLAPTDLAGQASPAQWAPHDRADAFLDAQWHELPFVVAADERVIDLMGDIARP